MVQWHKSRFYFHQRSVTTYPMELIIQRHRCSKNGKKLLFSILREIVQNYSQFFFSSKWSKSCIFFTVFCLQKAYNMYCISLKKPEMQPLFDYFFYYTRLLLPQLFWKFFLPTTYFQNWTHPTKMHSFSNFRALCIGCQPSRNWTSGQRS